MEGASILAKRQSGVRGESLAAAVAEVGRYTPVEFVIEDENLQQVRVAGLFQSR